jgi:uncharacterized membrane protein YfcA
MDGSILVLFVFAAFAGGFVSGFSGFAMGLVVSGVWLHIITPVKIHSGADPDPARRPVAGRAGGACQTVRTPCR